MIKRFTLTTLIIALFLGSCNTSKYIYDNSSFERQKELRKSRSGNVFADIGLSIASVFLLAAVDVDLGLYPDGHEFKSLNLINPTADTMYVNMLTDIYWDENDYCDFMDIRIPPNKECKVLIPVDANYNLYFSNTPENNDDEMLEIFTSDIKKISLQPGLTILKDTVNLNH